MNKETIKRFALKHTLLLGFYRKTFGIIKTRYFFNAQKRALQNKGGKIITKIDRELCKFDVNYFIDCGTLLGYVRDLKPIEYDRDIDFGIYFDEAFTPEKLIEILKKIGLKIKSIGYFEGVAQELTFSDGILHIDFFRHTEIDDKSLLYVFYRDTGTLYPTKEDCSVIAQKRIHIPGFKRVKIGDIESFIPVNTEEYLTSAYTKNWRIPNPNWRYTMEPGCTYLDKYGKRIHY